VLDTLVLWEKECFEKTAKTRKERPRKRFGSEFHVDGPATANAWLLYVIQQCGGTCQLMAGSLMRMLLRCNLGDWCPLPSAPPDTVDTVPSWHRHIIMQSLYLMHPGMSGQWRSACSCVRPRSKFLVSLTTRAAFGLVSCYAAVVLNLWTTIYDVIR